MLKHPGGYTSSIRARWITLVYLQGYRCKGARVQGLVVVRQPYKDTGLEFGGRQMTKRSAESANTRTVGMENGLFRWITGD